MLCPCRARFTSLARALFLRPPLGLSQGDFQALSVTRQTFPGTLFPAEFRLKVVLDRSHAETKVCLLAPIVARPLYFPNDLANT